MAGPVLDLATVGDAAKLSVPASREAMLAKFDTEMSKARTAVATAGDADLLSPWTLKHGTHELFTVPKIAALRSFVMNHMIHHRGQLSVYLRLRNVPVPPIYGSSADEQ